VFEAWHWQPSVDRAVCCVAEKEGSQMSLRFHVGVLQTRIQISIFERLKAFITLLAK